MSAADDVYEMQSLCEYIAERLASGKTDKDRANALYGAFNTQPHRREMVSWNRCFEFLRAKARRVDSWEKDLARAHAESIRQAERERKTREHIEWLRSIHEHAAESGADMDRSEIVALERVLARVGALDSALGSSASAGETR